MNLYLFNDNDSAATFGIGTYLNELTNALKDSAIHVHIVHLHATRPEFNIEKADQIEHWYIPEVRNENTFSGSIQKIEAYFRNVIYLLRLNIKDKKNLVFHFNYNLCFALAKGLKEVYDCKTVTTVHFMKWAFELQGNLQTLHVLKSKPESQMNPFEQILLTTDEYEYLFYKEVDHVISLSQYNKNLLCIEYQLDPNKISVIPNGLNDAASIRVNAGEDLRKKWCISEKESLILFAGRLHSIKGLIFLIRVFRKILEIIPDCRLIIAGSGHYDTYFQEIKGIYTKVTFTGLLEKKELYELYRITDVGVVPSLFEPFGYVAVEMMMHGLPVVATETSGLNEVIDESCGLKVPIIQYPDKVEIDMGLLAEKIVYLLQYPVEAKKVGQNGRKRYLKEFSSKVFRKNMLNFYHSIL